MYAISLSSIPPRFGRLTPVLQSLLAQDPAPEAVFLCLPRAYLRFPGTVVPPPLPEGVQVLWTDTDFGPATKAIAAARHLAGTGRLLIYCDDDLIMPPGWAAALLAAAGPQTAAAGAGFNVDRLRRSGRGLDPESGFRDVAMGFAGVAVEPAWLAGPEVAPPETARAADDLWLSGQLARQGVAVRVAPVAREGMTPAFHDEHALQDAIVGGRSRRVAYRDCADLLTNRYGVWPAWD